MPNEATLPDGKPVRHPLSVTAVVAAFLLLGLIYTRAIASNYFAVFSTFAPKGEVSAYALFLCSYLSLFFFLQAFLAFVAAALLLQRKPAGLYFGFTVVLIQGCVSAARSLEIFLTRPPNGTDGVAICAAVTLFLLLIVKRFDKTAELSISAVVLRFLDISLVVVPVLLLWVPLTRWVAHAVLPMRLSAPESSFELRRDWGELTFGVYLLRIDQWISDAPLIRETVGKVQQIAPIGEPNYVQSCFTDGCYATMNLEVIGEDGNGRLYLPYVEIITHYDQERLSLSGEALWSSAGVNYSITFSGEDLLKERGLAERLHRFNQAYNIRDFQKAVEELDGVFAELESLPDFIRIPLYSRYAESLASIGKQHDAADILTKAAQKIVYSGRTRQQIPLSSIELDYSSTTDLYDTARQFLVRAHELNPDLDLRFSLSRLLTEARDYKHQVFNARPPQLTVSARREWAENYLGEFLEAAEYYIKKSPEVAEIGTIEYIVPTDNQQNNVELSEDGYYSAFLHLTIRGILKTRYFKAFLKENKKGLPPVDLFAEQIREPRWNNMRFRSTGWGDDPDRIEYRTKSKALR